MKPVIADDPLGDNASGLKALLASTRRCCRVAAGAERFVPSALAIRPEFVAEFVAIHGITNDWKCEPFSRFRKVLAFEENDAAFYAIERRGYRVTSRKSLGLEKYLAAREFLADALPALGWRRVKGYASSLDRLQQVIDLVTR